MSSWRPWSAAVGARASACTGSGRADSSLTAGGWATARQNWRNDSISRPRGGSSSSVRVGRIAGTGNANARLFSGPAPSNGLWKRHWALQSLAVRVASDVRTGDFRNFAAGVADFNLRAGEPFRGDQGGAYAGRAVTEAVETLRGWGYRGIGQSSWGPTVFCFVPDSAEAESVAERARVFFPSDFEIQIARPNNSGRFTNRRLGGSARPCQRRRPAPTGSRRPRCSWPRPPRPPNRRGRSAR